MTHHHESESPGSARGQAGGGDGHQEGQFIPLTTMEMELDGLIRQVSDQTANALVWSNSIMPSRGMAYNVSDLAGHQGRVILYAADGCAMVRLKTQPKISNGKMRFEVEVMWCSAPTLNDQMRLHQGKVHVCTCADPARPSRQEVVGGRVDCRVTGSVHILGYSKVPDSFPADATNGVDAHKCYAFFKVMGDPRLPVRHLSRSARTAESSEPLPTEGDPTRGIVRSSVEVVGVEGPGGTGGSPVVFAPARPVGPEPGFSSPRAPFELPIFGPPYAHDMPPGSVHNPPRPPPRNRMSRGSNPEGESRMSGEIMSQHLRVRFHDRDQEHRAQRT